MPSIFDDAGLIGVQRTSINQSGIWSLDAISENISQRNILSDNFETFSGWTTQGSGVFAQSSARAYSGTFSGLKSTNGHPNGAVKLLNATVTRNFEISCWINSVSPRGASSADRVFIANSSGSGYGMRVDATNLRIETVTTSFGSAVNIGEIIYTRVDDTWYRAVLRSNPDNTFTFSTYNTSGNLLGTVTSTANTTHLGPFDRVAVLGGFPYHVDDLQVRTFS